MLDGLYKPSAVAVIGASRNQLSIGYRVLANLRDNRFNGPLFPVNPKEKSILGFRCYGSLLDIPDPVDLVNISIPAKMVPAAIDECGKKGVKFAIVHSAGFKETGPEGAKIEKEALARARAHGIRIYGPNSQGVMNSDPDVSLYANFTFTPMKPGSISILAQSGGIAELMNLQLAAAGAGFRMYGSNGNASDISIDELLAYFGSDEKTRVILLYVESFQDPAKFVEVASAITPRIPILAIKAGTSAEGARAITSHTGALMGRDTLTDALFERAGVLRYGSIQEVVQAALAFARQPLPAGDKIAIVTNAGGPAIQATDKVMELGLGLSKLSDGTKAAIREKLNPMSSVENPVDMTATAGPEQFGHTIRTLRQDPEVQAILLSMVTPFFVDNEGVVREVLKALEGCTVPVVATYLTNMGTWGHIVEQATKAGIPAYDYPETAAAVLAAMCDYARIRARTRGEVEKLAVDAARAAKVVEGAPRDADGYIPQAAAFEVLACAGIAHAPVTLFAGVDELARGAGALTYPVVLKADAEGLVHKTEAGAVAVGIDGKEKLLAEARRMADRLAGRKVSFVVQPQASGAAELILGMNRDASGLALVMAGMGGIFTEVFHDARFALAPLTREDACRMLRGLKGYGILAGARGRAPVDLAALEEMLLRVSQLAAELPGLLELDLNPVFASTEKGRTLAVDVRMRFGK